MRKKLQVAVNDKGARVGASNPGARLSDQEVDLIRELYEDGYTTSMILEKFDRMVTRQQVWRVVTCRSRADVVDGVRELCEQVCRRCGGTFMLAKERLPRKVCRRCEHR